MEISVLIVSRTLVSTRERRRHNALLQGLQRLIHPSAWNRISGDELRIRPFLGS
jgi:hypothetical protein